MQWRSSRETSIAHLSSLQERLTTTRCGTTRLRRCVKRLPMRSVIVTTGDCDKNGNPYPEWSDLHGEFATTYRPRAASGESAEITAERAGKFGESAETTADSKEKKGESREKSREKTSESREKSREKIVVAIRENPNITMAELARATGLSAKGVEKNIRRDRKRQLGAQGRHAGDAGSGEKPTCRLRDRTPCRDQCRAGIGLIGKA